MYVQMESPTQTIKIEQSQSDRSKIPYHPVRYLRQSFNVWRPVTGNPAYILYNLHHFIQVH